MKNPHTDDWIAGPAPGIFTRINFPGSWEAEVNYQEGKARVFRGEEKMASRSFYADAHTGTEYPRIWCAERIRQFLEEEQREEEQKERRERESTKMNAQNPGQDDRNNQGNQNDVFALLDFLENAPFTMKDPGVTLRRVTSSPGSSSSSSGASGGKECQVYFRVRTYPRTDGYDWRDIQIFADTFEEALSTALSRAKEYGERWRELNEAENRARSHREDIDSFPFIAGVLLPHEE